MVEYRHIERVLMFSQVQKEKAIHKDRYITSTKTLFIGVSPMITILNIAIDK